MSDEIKALLALGCLGFIVAAAIVDFLYALTFDRPVWARWWEGRTTRREMRKLFRQNILKGK